MARRAAPPPRPRRAAVADLSALAALERECFDDAWSVDAVEDELRHPDAVVLVVDDPTDGTLVAYACWRKVLDEAELLRLAVHPRARRHGLAGVLLAGGDTILAAADCSACFLEVREDNAGAIAFYEAAGFHRLGRRRGYYGGVCDAFIYARSLRPNPALEEDLGAAARADGDAGGEDAPPHHAHAAPRR